MYVPRGDTTVLLKKYVRIKNIHPGGLSHLSTPGYPVGGTSVVFFEGQRRRFEMVVVCRERRSSSAKTLDVCSTAQNAPTLPCWTSSERSKNMPSALCQKASENGMRRCRKQPGSNIWNCMVVWVALMSSSQATKDSIVRFVRSPALTRKEDPTRYPCTLFMQQCFHLCICLFFAAGFLLPPQVKAQGAARQ